MQVILDPGLTCIWQTCISKRLLTLCISCYVHALYIVHLRCIGLDLMIENRNKNVVMLSTVVDLLRDMHLLKNAEFSSGQK